MSITINGQTSPAAEFAWNGCHKIYLLDNGDADKNGKYGYMLSKNGEAGYKVLPVSELQRVWDQSCPLRFINNWALDKNMFPNATRSPSPSKRVERENHEIIQGIRGRIRSGYRSHPMGVQPSFCCEGAPFASPDTSCRSLSDTRSPSHISASRFTFHWSGKTESPKNRSRKSSIYEKPSRQKQTRNSFQTRINMPLFTRITLNPVNPDVRKVLRSPEAIHAVVSAATSGSSRPLWRLDGDRLYIVSDQLDTDRLEARLGKPIINTLDYRPFLDKLQNGETRRFTLTATPVVSKDGKRTPLRTPAGMHQWAEGKLTQAGARLDALDILDVHATRFNRQGRKLTFHTVEYTGEITITDRDKLTQTMLSGIGHGKAYGLGLMLLF